MIVTENDYGLGLNKISEIEITTSGKPVYPNGKLRVDDRTNINYISKMLNICFDLDDGYKYLSNFKVIIRDDVHEETFTNVDVNDLYSVDLEGFSRGYLTITVISDSSHPQSGLNIVLTTYKIYY